MADLLGSLLPLIIGSALVPVQILITVLLLRSASGRASALAWVLGLSTVRLAQGVVFGFVLGSSADAAADGGGGPGPVASTLLLVAGILFLVSAVRKLLKQPDEDAPPPRWMAVFESVSPGRAYLMGVVLMLVGVKFWAFTLGAIAVIGDAQLGPAGATAAFLVFAVLAASVHLVLLVVAYTMPARSEALLDGINTFLTRYDRPLMVTLGAVFGTWFLIKGLQGLGVL